MKTISFIRHTKASNDSRYKTDFDREISERGIEKISNLANVLLAKKIFPELIICSPSVRTTQTAELLIKSLNLLKTKLIFEKKLYTGSSSDYLNSLYAYDDSLNSIMIIGHNPSISEAAFEFDSSIEMMKTAQICHFEINCEKWQEINISPIISKFIINPKFPQTKNA